MRGIPEWAFGVVVILLVSSGLVLLVRWLQPEIARPDLKSGATDSTERSQTLEHVQLRLRELDQLKQRIGDLEERVDFAERLLAQQREGRKAVRPAAARFINGR
jgi:Tfp pilus assembly protein PilO